MEVVEKTHADSDLAKFFRAYMIYHKQNPNAVLDYTEINIALSSALSGLDEKYSTKEFILSIKSDFEIISRVLEKIAYQANKDIRSSEGIRDKYSVSDTYYTVPEIEARWVISGTAVRKAITEGRLRAKEEKGVKSKYRVLKEDFENYAISNGIKVKQLK